MCSSSKNQRLNGGHAVEVVTVSLMLQALVCGKSFLSLPISARGFGKQDLKPNSF